MSDLVVKDISEISDEEYEFFTGCVIYENGSKIYYLNGQRHRTDGPAVEHYSGTKKWWYKDQYVNVSSQEEFEQYLITLAFD